ncbi:MAG TPA: formimidoylglutamate deiminase [Dokdonella sp.]|uniref:formimidoylglutamate deiminase n=1 Tax=Dokdonella sp. TaxID=2291710 RepID=UPI002D7E9B51|nr:formimidoylglutamate deiminase [Dokdonella sp.]HET9034542.1 formimidoylglutamate deiminase [Dokdonella sp.]
MSSRQFHAENAWFADGWRRDVRFDIDTGRYLSGALLDVQADSALESAESLGHWVLPGMPNLHSHAFQRAMAGLAERRGDPADSFWTWREVMYAFASKIGPDDLRAIATQLYVEMLKAGYTQVCEFHYLHHQPDGRPYADPAAMSLALIEAAQEAGIGLTLLPTLYMTGGFDGRKLTERQRRFGHEVDDFLRLVERLRMLESSHLRIGVALHSLRAVPEDAMNAMLDGINSLPVSRSGLPGNTMPIHIHIAEQVGEVQDCLAVRNARPIEWLLDHAAVDSRWCLVHATHIDDKELHALARTRATVGLCPTTEANLGDGLFPLKKWLDAEGLIGIGSDSNISLSPVEELRWLEYGQRLISRHRNISANDVCASTGSVLFGSALHGGTNASGVPIGAFVGGDASLPSVGNRADLLVLDEMSPLLAGRDASNLLDTWLFAGNSNLVRDVIVNGDWVVRDFRHRDEARIAARYRAVIARLHR